MISLRLLTRNVTPQLAASTQRLHTSKISFNPESSDSDSSDDEKRKKNIKIEPKKSEANDKSVHRLNSLLQEMTKQSKVKSKVNIAVIPKRPIQAKAKIQSKDKSITRKLFEDKLSGAAKDVATHLGGDVNKTESELLKKILTPSSSSEESVDLSKLVMGMNIDRSKSKNADISSNRAEQVRAAMQRTNRYVPRQQQMDQPRMRERNRAMPIAERIDIDSGTPLNIFNTEPSEALVDPNIRTLSTWDLLERREHKLLVTHPPNNFLEQMIRWTEQGRLWRFPIDNEQDIHMGQEEHFSEHVFLEQHLEGWCPPRGPIRHFMELVCVGLSKNPYMFAKDKKARIMWFKEYFAGKRELLQELGAYGGAASDPGKKQIEA